MMEFEDAFDFYSMKHVTYGANPDSVKKSIRELRRIFSDLKNPYQKRFKEYRYVLLQNMSVPSYPKMQDSVIRRLNVLGPDYDNPLSGMRSTMCSRVLLATPLVARIMNSSRNW